MGKNYYAEQTNRNQKNLVYVAMSGGVDSSVAAAVLKQRGFRVVGVFFKPWSSQLSTKNYQLKTIFCNWRQDRTDAMRAAAALGVKFKTWDFSKEYSRQVARYMIDSYRRGLTPNPDVMCNKEIKFGLFLKKALAEGADYVATGHYARVRLKGQGVGYRKMSGNRNEKSETLDPKPYALYAGRDKNKDQSYFLWTLTQEQLRHCLFPIGDYTKPEVRRLAKRFGLPNWNKPDSQGVCFVGELKMHDFLTHYIKPRPGKIVLLDKKTTRLNFAKQNLGGQVGQHNGVYYYTIGQRHGLNITNGGGPYYVACKDLKRNVIYVTKNETGPALNQKITTVIRTSWVNNRPKLPLKVQVKIRYRNRSTPATITRNGSAEKLAVKFTEPVRAITPGQSAVFYRGQEVLGGGVIEN